MCTNVNKSTDVYDLINKVPVDHIWLEGGYTDAGDSEWVSISTKEETFKNAVVFVSVPDIPGDTSGEGYPAIARVRSVVKSGRVSFETKLYQANDSFCSKEWYVARSIAAVRLTWLVVEEGAFNLTTNMVVISSGPITRKNSDVSDYDNFVRYNYPVGCVSMTESCLFPVASVLGFISQLQTTVYDRLLIPRGFIIRRRFLRMVLQPHDSSDASYYTLLSPETVAYMAFEIGMKIGCMEGMSMESHIFTGVTHERLSIRYQYTYQVPPGVYGVIGTSTSLADSTGLRAFDRTMSGASIITQEDRCVDEETEHTTPETVYALIVGSQVDQSRCVKCNIRFTSEPTYHPTYDPTVEPTPAPTSQPSPLPTHLSSPPVAAPTACPSIAPSHKPSSTPTASPSTLPTAIPSRAPTVFPTETPTAVPTPVPTPNLTQTPTVAPTFTLKPISYDLPSQQPTDGWEGEVDVLGLDGGVCGDNYTDFHFTNGANITCLYVTATDLFGDAWGAWAYLYYWVEFDGVQSSNVSFTTVHCNCSLVIACLPPVNRSGEQRHFLSTDVSLEVPELFWEIHWTVQVIDRGVWGRKYYAGYNSTVVFDYVEVNNTFQLVYQQNLWAYPQNSSCLSLNISERDLTTEYLEILYSSGETAQFSVGAEWEAYQHPAYYISPMNSPDRVIGYSSSACGAATPGEEFPWLMDGSYLMRTTRGDNHINYTWNFCNRTGGAQEHFLFTVDGGVCFPGLLYTIDEVCGVSPIPANFSSSVPTSASTMPPTVEGSTNTPSAAPVSLVVTIAPTVVQEVNPAVQSLCNFYSDTNIADLNLDGWDCSPPGSMSDACSGWTGISCVDGNVTSINLSNKGLIGRLPDLGHLIYLERLDLSKNSLHGPVPESYGSLPSLRRIDLHHNTLSSTGRQLFTDKDHFHMRHLQTVAEDMETISMLPNLEYLDLSGNGYTGQVPAALCDPPLKTLVITSLLPLPPGYVENSFICIAACLLERAQLVIVRPTSLSACTEISPSIAPTQVASGLSGGGNSNVGLGNTNIVGLVIGLVLLFCIASIFAACTWKTYGSRKELQGENVDMWIDKKESRLNLRSLNSSGDSSVSSQCTNERHKTLSNGYEVRSGSSSDLSFPAIVAFGNSSDDNDDITADYFGELREQASDNTSSGCARSDDLTLSMGIDRSSVSSTSHSFCKPACSELSSTPTMLLREKEARERGGADVTNSAFVHNDLSFEAPSAQKESSQTLLCNLFVEDCRVDSGSSNADSNSINSHRLGGEVV